MSCFNWEFINYIFFKIISQRPVPEHFKKMLNAFASCLDGAPEIGMYEEVGIVKK